MEHRRKFDRPGRLLGPCVVLDPLEEHHREPMRAAASLDQGIWTYFPIGFNGAGERFDPWFDSTMDRYARDEHLPFAVRRRDDSRIIGTTRFYDIAPEHLRLAIGSTWYTPEARGTLINSEVRLLMLEQAFTDWSVNRVELITDPLNLASRAAMKILGAVEEGVIRNHLIYHDGRVRDSVLFSIVQREWPDVKRSLLEKLGYSAAEMRDHAD